MKEPSILDYLKGLFIPWKYPKVELPPAQVMVPLDTEQPTPIVMPEIPEPVEKQEVMPVEENSAIGKTTPEEKPREKQFTLLIPWASLANLFFALIAQNSLEPSPNRSWMAGLILYLMALACLSFALYRREWKIKEIPVLSQEGISFPDHSTITRLQNPNMRILELVIGLVLALLAFLTSAGNRFSFANVTFLILAIVLVLRAFWFKSHLAKSFWESFRTWLSSKELRFKLSTWNLVWIITIIVVIGFRFYHLNAVPAEMNSDHVEKILDISRLLAGQTNIFFPNNGGREALQMYLVAGLVRFLGIPLGFFALKLSTTLIGCLSLAFIYLLGKEIASPRVGWLAFVFAGFAYWTNIVSRLGLRTPFYILFTAAVLYFVVRGLKNTNPNDLLWAGIALGLSFYGYTANRVLPVLVAIILGIYLLHPSSRGKRKTILLGSVGLFLIALIIFLPMLRYSLEYPGSFFYRTFTRIGSLERPLPGPAWSIFLNNLGRALVMPSWSNGEIWTISIPHRPSLEVATGALYWIGLFLVIFRTIRQKHWLDFSFLFSIPILLLPSVMSLAFPAENPNLYRTGGMVVPVFIFIALAVDGLMSSLENMVQTARTYLKRLTQSLAWVVALFLVFWAARQSFYLIFRDYDQQYRLSSWNSSEMAKVMRDFTETIGSTQSTFLVGYPHWVDSRLVGYQAGQTNRDPGILPEQLGDTQVIPNPKLFILHPNDTNAIQTLTSLYPNGWINTYKSQTPTKDFIIYFVPPEAPIRENP